MKINIAQVLWPSETDEEEEDYKHTFFQVLLSKQKCQFERNVRVLMALREHKSLHISQELWKVGSHKVTW